MLKGAIFDFDGSLVDSMYIWEIISMDYLRFLGIEPEEKLNEVFEKFSLEEAAVYYQQNYGVTLSVAEIVRGVNEMIRTFYRTEVTLKKGIKDFLETMKQKDVKMCVATLSDTELVKETLTRLGIAEYFTEVFTCTEFGTGKTNPDIYRTALMHLGTPKDETFVFEDALYAAKTAKEDGFNVVGIYDKYEPNQDTLKQISDLYIQDYTDERLMKL